MKAYIWKKNKTIFLKVGFILSFFSWHFNVGIILSKIYILLLFWNEGLILNIFSPRKCGRPGFTSKFKVLTDLCQKFHKLLCTLSFTFFFFFLNSIKTHFITVVITPFVSFVNIFRVLSHFMSHFNFLSLFLLYQTFSLHKFVFFITPFNVHHMFC